MQVINPGLQTTLQGSPYSSHRHIGLPAAGAADCLSLAMANRIVGNEPGDLALEITLSGAVFKFDAPATIALTGAICTLEINDKQQTRHQAIAIDKGDTIVISPAIKGCRSYLAVSSGFKIETLLGGRSTYQPAGLGGHQGRALKAGDTLEFATLERASVLDRATPAEFVALVSNSVILRMTTGPEFDVLNDTSKTDLFENIWKADSRMSRMGVMLTGPSLETNKATSMPSAPVFPGTVQCPPNGSPFLLGPDAQTTGGYPRIAQVIRADRHLIGQLRPESTIQLVRTTPKKATKIYREKLALLKPWLGEIKLW